MITLKLSIVLSLRGLKDRGNLPVQYFHTVVHLDELYQEIAPKGIPFGPTSGAPLMPSSQ